MPPTPKAKSAAAERFTPGNLATEIAALRKELAALRSTKSPKRLGGKRRRPTGRRESAGTITIQALQQPVEAPSRSAPVYELEQALPATRETLRCTYTPKNEVAQEEDIFFGGSLDLARVNWLTGRWHNLAEIDLRQIEGHPDRARLALFGAIGWFSKNDWELARNYIQAAIQYGCPAKLISRALLSGAHSSLAAAYELAGRDRLSRKHQESAQKLMPIYRLLGGVGSAERRLEGSENGSSAPPDLSLSPRLRAEVYSAVSSGNPTEAVAQALRSADLTRRERFLFLRDVAAQFLKAGNKMVATGFLEEASHLLDALPETYRSCVIKDLLKIGLQEEAFEVGLRGIAMRGNFTPEEKQRLSEARDVLREKILNAKGHGHEVLLAFLSARADALRQAKGNKSPTLIEIGSTRESAAGQGSTRRLMDFCSKHALHFITVDMDSANTQMAAQMFRENGASFEAVHAKGEDFLASYDGDMDCIFLDAYDFDHGKHTELRQSRYEKFLGARISDADCHKMHFDCASAIVKKLQPWTIVCLDDTWLEEGQWVAKGTLAMPYLLKQGLQLLDVRNRSALLGGDMWFQKSPR